MAESPQDKKPQCPKCRSSAKVVSTGCHFEYEDLPGSGYPPTRVPKIRIITWRCTEHGPLPDQRQDI